MTFQHCACVTTETRPLDRLGQLGEFEQDSNTDSELESNTDSDTARAYCGAGQVWQAIHIGKALGQPDT